MPLLFVTQVRDDCPIWLISARSTAAGKTKSGPPCRRRRAKARQTTTGAARAVADLAQPASMIPASGSDLSAEDPIDPSGIAEDQRYQHGDANQHQELTVLRRGRLPDRDALRHDVGIHADAESRIGEHEQYERQQE